MDELIRKALADAYVAWREGRYSNAAFERAMNINALLTHQS